MASDAASPPGDDELTEGQLNELRDLSERDGDLGAIARAWLALAEGDDAD